jgi:hypothetical protein
MDNNSTDNSVEIAKSLGCTVVSFDSSNKQNEFVQADIKNNCWKHVQDGWVIVVDMDEWLCATEEELIIEDIHQNSILTVKGMDMIGESNSQTLNDINLHDIKKCKHNHNEDKQICFLRNKISEMNYSLGAHQCKPVGNVKYSGKVFINKHMNFLGLYFLINKMNERYKRTEEMRSIGLDTHYNNNIDVIKTNYYNLLRNAENI